MPGEDAQIASQCHDGNSTDDNRAEQRAEHRDQLSHRLAQTYTFALLQWPALFFLLQLDNNGWQLWLKFALGAWIALIALAAYGGRRADWMIFGNAMLVELGVLCMVWWTFPGYWCWLWLGIAAALFYTAQLALLASQNPSLPNADNCFS